MFYGQVVRSCLEGDPRPCVSFCHPTVLAILLNDYRNWPCVTAATLQRPAWERETCHAMKLLTSRQLLMPMASVGVGIYLGAQGSHERLLHAADRYA